MVEKEREVKKGEEEGVEDVRRRRGGGLTRGVYQVKLEDGGKLRRRRATRVWKREDTP